MSQDTYLREWDLISWVRGLGLLTLPWIKPFLPTMAIPEKLCNEPELWIDLYWKARNYSLSSMVNSEVSLIKNHEKQVNRVQEINEFILRQSLDDLATRTDSETVNAFCEWFNRHFLNRKYQTAIYQWESILVKAILRSSNSGNTEIQTNSIQYLMAEISGLVWWEVEYTRLKLIKMPITFLEEVFDELKNPLSELLDEDGYLTHCDYEYPYGDAGIVSDIIHRELTLKALKLIHQSSLEEEEEIIQWLTSLLDSSNGSKLEFSLIETIELSSISYRFID
jgi:hypothetical protein